MQGCTADAGDVFTFTATVAHTAASGAPAYNLVITDDVGALLVPGSATLVCVPDVCTGVTVDGSVLTFNVAELPLGSTLTITFTALVDQAVRPGDEITDSGSSALTYSSSGDHSAPRTYAPAPVVGDGSTLATVP